MRIVGGREWSYSLENPYTAEWQELAEIITEEVGRSVVNTLMFSHLIRVMWVLRLQGLHTSRASFLGLGSGQVWILTSS